MNSVDWSIIYIIGISTIISIIRGASKEALSLLIWLLSALIASIFHDQMQAQLQTLIENESLREISAWITIFLFCLFIGSLINYIFGKLIKASGLSNTDRLLGMIFGVVRAIVIVMVFLIITPKIFPVAHTKWWMESILIPFFQPFQGWAQETGSIILIFLKNIF